MSRTKGATFERWCVNQLKAHWSTARRNLDQVRDGGADILGVPNHVIECKAYERIAVYRWWDQVLEAVKTLRGGTGCEEPMLIIKANNQPPLAVMSLDYAMYLMTCLDHGESPSHIDGGPTHE